MDRLMERCREAAAASRRLRQVQPTSEQVQNITHRLRQIFTEDELARMDEKTLVKQVERVWPIAKYVDRLE
ncbi:MAG: hypothetical protein M5U01_38540 [Ardenticatenaceae bacterium]|nr:hypothetical protein [Ardenticatenaceae bacterium]